MALNVLIPARNEEEHIEKTLDAVLQAGDDTRVQVLVNGSTDRTAEIAHSFEGVEVTELEASGKYHALKQAMHRLGDQALDGFVILDADTHPIAPKRWVAEHSQRLGSMESGTYNGEVLYDFNAGYLGGLARNGLNLARILTQRMGRDSRHLFGTNLAIKPTEYTRDILLTAPNVWPAEDNMIIDIHDTFTDSKYVISLDPRLAAITSGRALGGARDRMRNGLERMKAVEQQRYRDLASADTVTYSDVRDAILSGEFLELAIQSGDYPPSHE